MQKRISGLTGKILVDTSATGGVEHLHTPADARLPEDDVLRFPLQNESGKDPQKDWSVLHLEVDLH